MGTKFYLFSHNQSDDKRNDFNSFIFGPEIPSELEDPVVSALFEIASDPSGLVVLSVLFPGIQCIEVQDHSAYVDLAELIAAAGMIAEEVWEIYYR